MPDENKGGITVTLDGDDIQHLVKHGSSTVTKDIGPIQVKIRCEGKVYPRFVLDERGSEPTEIFGADQE